MSRCYGSLASVEIDLSKADEALQSQQRAGMILQQIVATNPRDLDAQNALANRHFSRGYLLAFYLNKPNDAIDELELARKIEKEVAAAAPDRSEFRRVLAEIDGMLGILRLNRGETGAALDVYDEGRQTIEKLVAAEPNVTMYQSIHGSILGNLSFVYAKQGKLAEAIRFQRSSGEIVAKLAEADPDDRQLKRDLGGSFNNIGDLQLAAGSVPAALESYQKARSLIEPLVKAQPGVEHYQFGLAFSLSGLGHAHARLGSVADAVAELREAISIWNRVSVSSPESRYVMAGCHAILAGLLGTSGSEISQPAADDEARMAIEILKESLATGYRAIKEVRADADFKALAGRADFESLLMDSSLPRNPFAAGK